MRQRFFFCPACGAELIKRFLTGRERLVCCRCGRVHYENPIVGVAAIILNAEGQILMVKRSPNITYSGLWCIPCGYLEYDEDIRAGLKREIEEETNLVVQPLEVFAVHSNFHNPQQHTVGIWFLTEVLAGTPTAGDDASEVAWVEIADPPPLAFATDQLVLAELLEKKQSIDIEDKVHNHQK